MDRYVCIHGHFYQPPRENPWLEEIEEQDSAYPYHDWNQRVSAECYAPNTASRILDQRKRIINIVNNYSRISFNMGPTLLRWLAEKAPDVYSAVLDADLESQGRFSGHGAAFAQVYHHMIMPLANSRDKRTQVVWGIRDFEFRFKRKPEGMWLAETAVDLETLDIMAEQGILFTVLAPSQACRVVGGGRIDPKEPYRVNLPSGRTISIFFYDGPISQELAFGKLLESGDNFARRLVGAFSGEGRAQLVHIATDGETYGHHHRFGDMALAYCLYYIESNHLARITIYGEYLEKHPPTREVEILENTSWSCAHGIERWRSDCGCNSGAHPGWRQKWRGPLREAMDWLRDNLIKIYEEQARGLFRDPWEARNHYVDVILDRTEEKMREFLRWQAGRDLSWPEQVRARQLLEMQRHALMIYTSCGWFFDDISGIETQQVMLYAMRAMQLAKLISGIDLEPEYIKRVEKAPGNVPGLETGARVYEKYVKGEALDFMRVGAHYAISSLFEDYAPTINRYHYWVDRHDLGRLDQNGMSLVTGWVHIYTSITAEETDLDFAAVYWGEEEILGKVRRHGEKHDFESMRQELQAAFVKKDRSLIIAVLDRHFGRQNYSLSHLFRDTQRRVLEKITQPAVDRVRTSLRAVFCRYNQVMRDMNGLRVTLPAPLYTTARFVLNDTLRTILEAEEFNLAFFNESVKEIAQWPIKIDTQTLSFHATHLVNKLLNRCFAFPENVDWLEKAYLSLKTFNDPVLALQLDLWQAQNLYFKIGQRLYPEMLRNREKGSDDARRWLEYFLALGEQLEVRLS